MPEDPGSVALERLVRFGRSLRDRGLPVGTERILAFCRAAAMVDPGDLRWAARATLVSRHEDLGVLDETFARNFGERMPSKETAPALGTELGPGIADGRGQDFAEAERTAVRVVASDVERLRHKDFAEMTDAERRQLSAAIRRLAVAGPVRRTRRRAAAARGPHLDLRRTLRLSLRTEGEPFHRAWTRRKVRRRPLVVILDVSGSMSPYTRPLVEFAHAASRAGDRVEVFCFGTRLTRITDALDTRDPARALAAVGARVEDWEGGTRIGPAIGELVDRWGHSAFVRGGVAVLCSDGLERGDPAVLSRQVRRLSRSAHRLVWVNPLKGSPRYEPLARGMAASLPFVDVFLAGQDLRSLERLAEAIAVS